MVEVETENRTELIGHMTGAGSDTCKLTNQGQTGYSGRGPLKRQYENYCYFIIIFFIYL